MPDGPIAHAFAEERRRLFGIAYRILGSVADAEDVVQDAFIACRAAGADVTDPVAYAVRAVARRALNRRRDDARRRAHYVGPWLPEPMATEPGPEEAAETAEGLTMAMMVLMERLTPRERAAFVLTEAFGLRAPEAAEALDTTPGAIRQLVSRARRRLRAGGAGVEDTPAEHDRVAHAFGRAVVEGDVAGVLAVLAPDVVFVADGGGKALAMRVPLHGADRVAQAIVALARQAADARPWPVSVNGRTGFVVASDAMGASVYQFAVSGGRITSIWAMRNPDKLAGVPLTPPA